jgi:hypothetical protein
MSFRKPESLQCAEFPASAFLYEMFICLMNN